MRKTVLLGWNMKNYSLPLLIDLVRLWYIEEEHEEPDQLKLSKVIEKCIKFVEINYQESGLAETTLIED